MRVSLRHHLAIGQPFARALDAAGHELVDRSADVFMVDLDLPYYRQFIDPQLAAGAKVFTYPHGVGVHHYWDGIDPPYEPVHGTFVIAEGYAEVYRRLGMTRPLYVVGWPYCEQRPFRATDAPRKVLFAPEHPLQNGYLSDWQRQLNVDVYSALLEVPGIDLKVRHLYALEQNGIWGVDGVEYVQGQPDNSIDDIDAADVVVAIGTYAHLSVARGAPTIFFGQNVHPSNGEHPGERVYCKSWDRWRDYARYPFDMSDGPAADLIAAAARSEDPVREWKHRFIGDPMTTEGFDAQLERAVAVARLPELRSLVVVAHAQEVAADVDLLRAYTAAFGAGDDATLLMVAPGGNEHALVGALQLAFAEIGLDDDALPDMVLTTDPLTPAGEWAIAQRAAAFLSERPDELAPAGLADLPRHSAATVADLRAGAAAQLS
jgi:hypothetical protein